MKTGRDLPSLLTEVERVARSAEDYVADTRRVSTYVVDPEVDETTGEPRPQDPTRKIRVALDGVAGDGGLGDFGIRSYAHGQIASALKIPKTYYDRLLASHPDLLTHDLNALLQREPTKQMFRTVDGDVRAYLSDKYRPLDNYDLLDAILPSLLATPGLEIISCELTETRLYLKATTTAVKVAVKVGDEIQAGVCFTNSEIGAGSLAIYPWSLRLLCTNGMKHEAVSRKYHVGARYGIDESASRFFRDDTRKATDRAFWKQIRDVTAGLLQEEEWERIVAPLRKAAEIEVVADPIAVVEKLAKKVEIREDERNSLLRHLIREDDFTAWGYANAVTRAAEDVPDYDRATELETLGDTVARFSRSDWAALAAA